MIACLCEIDYIVRTTRCLAKRVKEHHPTWLNKDETTSITSSIAGYILDIGHTMNITEAFRVVNKLRTRLPKINHERILSTTEAIAIHLLKSSLCHHKKFVKALC